MPRLPCASGEELDAARLSAYLTEQLGKSDARLEIEQFPQGFSNLTYLVRFGSEDYVLRRPPFGNHGEVGPRHGPRVQRPVEALESLRAGPQADRVLHGRSGARCAVLFNGAAPRGDLAAQAAQRICSSIRRRSTGWAPPSSIISPVSTPSISARPDWPTWANRRAMSSGKSTAGSAATRRRRPTSGREMDSVAKWLVENRPPESGRRVDS